MGNTLKWYEQEGVLLPKIQADSSFPYRVMHQDLIGLSREELAGLWQLFPSEAQKRSILRRVLGNRTTWFHEDSTQRKPVPTEGKSKALSPTALVPSYVKYGLWGKKGDLAADIVLYTLPREIPTEVRRVVTGQGFIHEVGHTLTAPALYVAGYKLRSQEGKVKEGLEHLLQFAKRAERHPPISHYASTYRKRSNQFPQKDVGDWKIAVSEEMCECIAAYILGFAYKRLNVHVADPFKDRPDVKESVEDFLYAKRVR